MSLKYAILGLLEDQPYYGYEIKQKFEQMMGDLWPVSYGQLYPTLRKLANDQLVTMKTVQGKKAVEKNVYSITSDGRTAFIKWLRTNKKKVQHSIKDEFTLSFFFLERLSQDHVHTFLSSHLEDTMKQVRDYSAQFSRIDGDTPFYKKVLLRKMLFHLEAEQKWLRSVITDMQGSSNGHTQASGQIQASGSQLPETPAEISTTAQTKQNDEIHNRQAALE